MGVKANARPWISKEKMYQPVKNGGLNCIELTSFFKIIKLNWMNTYITEQYKDYWTEILDTLLEVTPATRREILKWGSDRFTDPIKNCKFSAIKPLLLCMQELTAKFVTPPERGDNRYIFQPVFQNQNLKYKKTVRRSKKSVTFQQTDFGIPPKVNVTVNEIFNREKFFNYDKFCEKICQIHENGYLAIKSRLTSIFKLKNKYPPPIINKHVPDWNIESMEKLFQSKFKGSKKIRKIIFQKREVSNNLNSWKKSLKDQSISLFDIKMAHEFVSKKTLHPKYHDKKFRLLARKTQFNNQL